MLSWLIVLCLLLIALCASTPPRVDTAAVPVVAARSAIGTGTYPATSAICAKGDDRREDTGLPENPFQRDYSRAVGCAGGSGPPLTGPGCGHRSKVL